jgi:hypothetical protein
LSASAVRIDIGSDGEILPDSIQNLKSAVRTTTPNKSSNPVAGRIRNQRRDLMLHGVGATGFEPRVAVYLLPYPASVGSTEARNTDKVVQTPLARLSG